MSEPNGASNEAVTLGTLQLEPDGLTGLVIPGAKCSCHHVMSCLSARLPIIALDSLHLSGEPQANPRPESRTADCKISRSFYHQQSHINHRQPFRSFQPRAGQQQPWTIDETNRQQTTVTMCFNKHTICGSCTFLRPLHACVPLPTMPPRLSHDFLNI